MIYKVRDSVRISIRIFWFTCLNSYSGDETWRFVDIFLTQFQIEWCEKKWTGDTGDTKALKIQCGHSRHSSSSLDNKGGQKTFPGSFCTGTTSGRNPNPQELETMGWASGQLKWHQNIWFGIFGIHPPLIEWQRLKSLLGTGEIQKLWLQMSVRKRMPCY